MLNPLPAKMMQSAAETNEAFMQRRKQREAKRRKQEAARRASMQRAMGMMDPSISAQMDGMMGDVMPSGPLAGMLGAQGGAYPVGGGYSGPLPDMPGGMAEGIASAAARLGISPVDLATVISYETGGTMNPMQGGPTTQWGHHRGLIQFGEPQARQYGVDFSSPEAALASQLGPDGAIVKYLLGSGFEPGMGLMDLYSTINAGSPGRYGASDAQNGGAWGTVADKVNYQMAEHRAAAERMFGGASPQAAPQTGGGPLGMIGGVKPGGGFWQGLNSSGLAHAADPDYQDYSQLFRDYSFTPQDGWVNVGERDGRAVYAAPDDLRDASGNYVSVSSASARDLARQRGTLIPTRAEVRALYKAATPITMPTQPIGQTGGAGSSAAYTQAVDQALSGMAPGTPVYHGKEFFAPSAGASPGFGGLFGGKPQTQGLLPLVMMGIL